MASDARGAPASLAPLYAAWSAGLVFTIGALAGALGPNLRLVEAYAEGAGSPDPEWPRCLMRGLGMLCSGAGTMTPPSIAALTLAVALVGLVGPAVHHRRALRRLLATSPAARELADDDRWTYRRAPDARLVFSGAERAARLARHRYLERLMLALLTAFAGELVMIVAASPTVGFDGGIPSPAWYVPGPWEYAPLAVCAALVVLAHFPTRRRVFGAWIPAPARKLA